MQTFPSFSVKCCGFQFGVWRHSQRACFSITDSCWTWAVGASISSTEMQVEYEASGRFHNGLFPFTTRMTIIAWTQVIVLCPGAAGLREGAPSASEQACTRARTAGVLAVRGQGEWVRPHWPGCRRHTGRAEKPLLARIVQSDLVKMMFSPRALSPCACWSHRTVVVVASASPSRSAVTVVHTV